MIFFEKVSDWLTKRRDRDLPSMRQMKAETEIRLLHEFQANRSMFRYFPESRQNDLQIPEQSSRGGNCGEYESNALKYQFLAKKGKSAAVKSKAKCRDSGMYLNMLRLA